MKPYLLLSAALTMATLQAAPIPLNLPRPDDKPGDATKPVKVYILAGQSNMVGMGDLVTLTKKDGNFPYLIDDAGNWAVRNDVYFQEARLTEGGKDAPMTPSLDCLVDIIQDLRKEFKAPKMKAVVATVGFEGYRLMSSPWKGV